MAGSLAAAERPAFERYQSVIDRQMFGPVPVGFDPTKSPTEAQKTRGKGAVELTKEQEQVKKAVRFSVINVMPDGTVAVGFSDLQDPKYPRHYYLKVGESRDDWTVREADAQTGTMTISKGDVELTLTLGDETKGGAEPAKAPATSSLLSAGTGSLRSRRLLREQQQQQALEARMKAAEQERAAAQAKAEADAAQRASEREEQRKELLQIKEELRQAREARQAAAAAESAEETGGQP